MKEADKELIKEISNLFEDYEEEYVPGEWEKFQAVQKPSKFIFPLWMKVAAMLAVIAAAAILFRPSFNAEKNQKYSSEKIENKLAPASDQPNAVEKVKEKPEEYAIQRTPEREIAREKDKIYKSEMTVAEIRPSSWSAAGVNAPPGKDSIESGAKPKQEQVYVQNIPIERTPEEVPPAKVVPEQLQKQKTDRTLDFLMSESQKQVRVAKNERKTSKWDFGLEVMPTATNSAVNVGAGLTTAYELSDEFSLSSGISLLNLQSGTVIKPDPNAAPNSFGGGGDFSEQKRLDGTSASIRAIDIPLALVYKLNKNFYTSAGFSYVNVVSERRSNNFVQNSLVQRSSKDPATGTEYLTAAMSVEKTQEPEPVTPLKGNSYMGGFFNFSIGRRQQIFQKYDILVEPFIKVPVGRLSREDVQLMNSGIKLQFAF
ncbi:hypothetical protein [Pedobacter antarcticus]|uniref:hypothetical protein n=1 Tax=Pedobacter antarcticus TaxID=34086 RepID=UPI00292DB439|nr:hypothetical protein [Pedobacter antarcticus]